MLGVMKNKKMKYILIILFGINLLQPIQSQKSHFEKYDVVDLMKYDNITGVAPRLIEIVGDSILLIGGYLSEYYLYDLKNNKLIKEKRFEENWKAPSDIIKTQDGNFIINYDWGLLFLDRNLDEIKRMEITSSQLMEIKLSEKGTVFQRTEKEIREIDIEKLEIISSFNFEEKGYDIELVKNKLLLTNGMSEILLLNLKGEIEAKFKLKEEEDIFEGVVYFDKQIYTPITFENKVMITNIKTHETTELKTELPTKLIKLKSGELIIGNGNGEVLIFKENNLEQTIIQETQEYGHNNPLINHIEMNEDEKYLVFTGEGSNRIFIYRKIK